MIIKHYIPGSQVVLMSAELLEQIYRSSMTEYPNEFGGILAGIRLGNIWTIVDFQEPTKYQNSSVSFTRDASSLNVYLQKVFEESTGQIEYLGEWHSHPDGSTKWSNNDRVSMIEIAEDVNIKVENPLLLVIGNSKRNFSYSLFQCIQGNLIKHKLLKI